MRSLTRALAALEVLTSHPSGLSLRELTAKLGVPVASTHRLLEALCDEEFVERSPTTKRYFLGSAALAMSATAGLSARLHHVPPGAIARASVASGETVLLGELWSGRPVCVALALGRRPPRPAGVLGAELPPDRACSARVLVMDANEQRLRGWWRRCIDEHSEQPSPEEDELINAVMQARERGYDMAYHDLDGATWAVSVPVRDTVGRVRQCVTVLSTPTRAARPAVQARYLEVARQAATELRREWETGLQPPARPAARGLTARSVLPAGDAPGTRHAELA